MGSKIFWAIVAGFLLGVISRSFAPLGWGFVGFLSLLGAATLALSWAERRSAYVVSALFFLAAAAGIVRMDAATLRGDPVLTAQLGTKVTLEGVVVAEPDVRDSGVRTSVRAERLIAVATSSPISATLMVALPPRSAVRYGERVRLVGVLQLPAAFDTGVGRSFAYPEFLAKDGVAYQMDRVRFERLAEPQLKFFGTPNYFAAGAIAAKQRYLRALAEVLPQPEAAFAGGITAGDKRSVGPELTAAFQRDSLVHVLVLSGYNITVVLNALAKLLSFAPRALSFAGAGAVVVFFMLMSGGAASATRAGLMALIAVYARQSGRLFLAERALGAVSLVMVAWNPWTLAFDPGFQLSALATLGLILFTEHIAARLRFIPEKFGLREIAASTLATQLTVLPLLLYGSGTLSLVALPANLLALFPIPYAMFFSFIAGLVGALLGHAGAVAALPAYVLLSYTISIARLFAALPFAAVALPAFSARWMLAAYVLIFGVFFYVRRRSIAAGAQKATAP